jgi:hypothetical protein
MLSKLFNKMNDKDRIVQMLKAGSSITATWDAGGDQTLCEVLINGKHRKESELLADKIIDALSLPNASEYYHKGAGTILLNEREEVVLQYSSREHTYGEDVVETVALPLADPAGLRSLLHKCEIEFSGRWETDSEMEVDVLLETVFGDPVQVEETQWQFYKEALAALIRQKRSDPDPSAAPDEELARVWLSGKLTADSLLYLRVEKMYDKAQYHRNARVVLL